MFTRIMNMTGTIVQAEGTGNNKEINARERPSATAL